mmetsp:Transcript_114691/g.180566  ORF Transcript_114691/g.180566 Transcript_114691/m.180566 type:complete len:411 (-) Transcript_114691:622-1854(-)
MDGDATQESEVPQVLEEGADDGNDGKEKAGSKKKGKQRFQKVENLADFYQPKAYEPQQKGRGKGSKGEGKGDREGGKGKGKRNYFDESPQKEQPQEDSLNSPPSVAPGPATADGDGSQSKGASAKKKPNNKGRGEGKGSNKGGAIGGKADAPKKGGGRGGGGGGKAPRGPAAPNEMPEQPMLEVEGPRAPGPQQQQQPQQQPRPPLPMKGAMAPAGMPNVPMAPQFPFSNVPSFPFQGGPSMMSPYQMPGGIYTLPTYYVMQPQSMSGVQQPFLPGGGGGGMPPGGAPPMSAPTLDRTTIVTQARLQVEHYFSMENLLKDMFLRRNMNEEGWVPISLIGGWPAMQKHTQFSQDPSVLIEAISTSTIVEPNPQNSHLRLRRDWEKWVVPSTGNQQAPPMQAPGAAALRPPV